MMKSKIASYLNLELNPVAIIWSNEKPEGALQFKQGKYSCAMRLVAAAAKGRTAVLDASTSGCVTAAAAFGFGKFEDKWPLGMDLYYGFLSCGMKDKGIADDMKELINAASKQGSAPQNMVDFLMEGEGYKKTRELVKEHVDSWPVFQIEEKYVILKPLKDVDIEHETPVQIIFFANPNQLSALIILASCSTGRTDRVKVGGGSACQDVSLFAYQEAQEENPRAVLGFKDIFARNNLKKTVGTDKMTLTVPMKLFWKMEEDADNSLLVRHTWRELSGEKA
jgi:uncharacterized protein (DUF169 family)